MGVLSLKKWRVLVLHSVVGMMVSQGVVEEMEPDEEMLVPATEMAGAWLPVKKVVSTSTAVTVPEGTPSWRITQ